MADDSDSLLLSISADVTQVQRALKRLTTDSKSSTDAVIKNFTSINPAVDRTAANIGKVDRAMAQSSKATGFAVTNLRFQLQDLQTQILSGGSPFTAIQQQMTQMTGAVSGLTRGAALGALGRALISPWTLIPAAIGVGTLAMQKYFSEAEDGSDKSSTTLKDHAELIRRVVAEWEKAPAVIKAAADAEKELTTLSERRQAILGEKANTFSPLAEAMTKIEPQVTKVLGLFERFPQLDIQPLITRWKLLLDEVRNGGASAAEVQDFFATLNAEIAKLPVGAARTLAETLQKQVQPAIEGSISKIGELDAAMQKLGQDSDRILSNMALAFSRLAGPLGPLADALRRLIPDGAVGAIPGSLAGAGFDLGALNSRAVTATPSAAKMFLKTKAASKKIAERIDLYDDAYASALAKLFTILPDTARIASGPRTFAEQKAIRDSGVRPAAPPGTSRHEQRGDLRPAAADITGVSSAALQRAVDQIKELETGRGFNDPNHVQLAGSQAKAIDGITEARQRQYETTQAAIEATARETELMKVQASALGTATDAFDAQTYAVEFATKQQELLNTAKKDGTAATPDEIAQIRAVSDAYAQQKASIAGVADAAKQAEIARVELQNSAVEKAQALSQAGMSFAGSFISAMRQGKSATEALNDALQSLIDTLLQQALQSIFSPQNFLGLFGGGGVSAATIAGLPAGLYAKGGVVGDPNVPHRLVDPNIFRGARSMARGGMVGGGIPIIAHAGEVVIPKNMVGRGGGAGVVDNSTVINSGNIQIDMANAGLVTASTKDAKTLGEMIKRSTQAILVAESRPGGLLRKV